ncbi:hypothetical protein EV018_07185 [Citrobacter freundii]|nr:hypothetical protein EV018_07185 [Citrobacter freundii]
MIIQRSYAGFQLNFAAFYSFLLITHNKQPVDAQTLSSMRNLVTNFARLSQQSFLFFAQTRARKPVKMR